MDCYILGFISFALLFGSFFTLSVSKKQHNELKNILSDELDKKYESIIIERRNLYLLGIILGILFSFIILSNIVIKNNYTRITLFFSVTLGTSLIFYMTMPKSDYMLNHLQTLEENKNWLNIYTSMKYKYFIGIVLGMLVSIPISMIYCKFE